MMPSLTINLTDAEYKALSYLAYSVEEWVENVVRSRAQSATEDIVKIEVQNRMKSGETIPSNQDELVRISNLPSAKKRQDDFVLEMRNRGAA